MAKPNTPPAKTREAWLIAATEKLREHFDRANENIPLEKRFVIPPKIRYAIAFPSTGKRGNRQGETWAPGAADGYYEVILRSDLGTPVKVLTELAKQLLHAALPLDHQHGKLYRDAAIVVGFVPPMRTAKAGAMLQDVLARIADQLEPLPHDALDINGEPLVAIAPQPPPTPLNGPKKERTRNLQAKCLECDNMGEPFIVRVTETTTRNKGAPLCPIHKTPLHVTFPDKPDAKGTEARKEGPAPELGEAA